MKKLIFVYGFVAGLVIILIGTLSIHMGVATAWLGFLVMFIAFSSIFVAVKQYRDDTLGGVMRFGTGFLVGLGITLVASIVYVLVWELYLAMTDYAYIDTFIEGMREGGYSNADAEAMVQQYSNLMFRLPMTFVEIFPIGFLVSLISAFILKDSKKLPAQ